MDNITEVKQVSDSDVVFAVCCSVCEDDKINTQAKFHCEKCVQYFCESCVALHNKLHKNHSVSAKGNARGWPGGTSAQDTLELCDEHSTEKLKMFCEDHVKLLCHVCHLSSHRQCRNVVLIADKLNESHENLEETVAKLTSLQETLTNLKTKKERNILSMYANYEQMLQKLNDFRRQVDEQLDCLQQTTLKELEIIRDSALSSLRTDIERCQDSQAKLKSIHDLVEDIDNSGHEITFVAHRKCEEKTSKSEKMLQELSINDSVEINFCPNNTIIQFLSSCSGLGVVSNTGEKPDITPDPNHTVRLQDSAEYNVKMENESLPCSLSGICETSNSELIVTDFHNKCVKLLDEAYTVMEHLNVRACPYSVCSVSPVEVVVTTCDRSAINEIVVIRKANGKLVKDKAFRVEHPCYGIANHQGDLFVTSGTALYNYTMDGRLVKKLYENTLGEYTVVGCGISPDGRRLYVTDINSGKLLTLVRDGAVTATLHDPVLINKFLTCNMHVSDIGQMFVCGRESVSQVDTEGRTILKTHNSGISNPASVFLSMHTNKLYIGTWNNDNLKVFKINLQ